MKAETKKLIADIKAVIEACLAPDDSDFVKAIDFLDSLPGLEEQLKHGGFIPDRNNKPCKDGDKIKLIFKNTGDVNNDGFLRWDSEKYCFYAVSRFEDWEIKFDIAADGEYEFERIDSGAEK